MAEENNERTYFGIKLTGKEDVKNLKKKSGCLTDIRNI